MPSTYIVPTSEHGAVQFKIGPEPQLHVSRDGQASRAFYRLDYLCLLLGSALRRATAKSGCRAILQCAMSSNASCVVRNGTGDPCCVSVFASGIAETPEEYTIQPDDEICVTLDASQLSYIAARYLSQPVPSTHPFPAGTGSAIVELTASLTSSASVGTAGTDEKQKLTFVNQCSVDIWFRLFFKDDYKDRLVFAGGSEAYEFDDAHVTSFGAKFQYPAKNGVSDFRWLPIHQADAGLLLRNLN